MEAETRTEITGRRSRKQEKRKDQGSKQKGNRMVDAADQEPCMLPTPDNDVRARDKISTWTSR
jgi:hypothetical protein